MIHTASMAGRNVGPMSGAGYTAAKHGVVAMSHSLNMEECVNSIRSTAFCPGEVNTADPEEAAEPAERGGSGTDAAARGLRRPDPLYRGCLPPHVTMNEVWLTPTFNRGYVAALGRKL